MCEKNENRLEPRFFAFLPVQTRILFAHKISLWVDLLFSQLSSLSSTVDFEFQVAINEYPGRRRHPHDARELLANMSNRDAVMRDQDSHSDTSDTEASTDHVDSESSDDYVDARASHYLKKPYLQTKKTTAAGQREPKGGPVLTHKSLRRLGRPKRARTNVNYTFRAASHSYSPSRTEVCLTSYTFLECRDAYSCMSRTRRPVVVLIFPIALFQEQLLTRSLRLAGRVVSLKRQGRILSLTLLSLPWTILHVGSGTDAPVLLLLLRNGEGRPSPLIQELCTFPTGFLLGAPTTSWKSTCHQTKASMRITLYSKTSAMLPNRISFAAKPRSMAWRSLKGTQSRSIIIPMSSTTTLGAPIR